MPKGQYAGEAWPIARVLRNSGLVRPTHNDNILLWKTVESKGRFLDWGYASVGRVLA